MENNDFYTNLPGPTSILNNYKPASLHMQDTIQCPSSYPMTRLIETVESFKRQLAASQSVLTSHCLSA